MFYETLSCEHRSIHDWGSNEGGHQRHDNGHYGNVGSDDGENVETAEDMVVMVMVWTTLVETGKILIMMTSVKPMMMMRMMVMVMISNDDKIMVVVIRGCNHHNNGDDK